MKKFLHKLKIFLEKINNLRDEALFIFIRPYWPRQITPNSLSYLRIAIAILLFLLLFIFKIDNKFLIVFLFVAGALTDIFDGSVARALDKATKFGAVLDPVADRFLIIPIAIYGLYRFNPWLLLTLASTEIINAIFSIYYRSREIYLESGIHGKTKMVLICVSLVGILVFWPHKPPSLFIDILWISIIFSFLNVLERTSEMKKINNIKNEKHN